MSMLRRLQSTASPPTSTEPTQSHHQQQQQQQPHQSAGVVMETAQWWHTHHHRVPPGVLHHSRKAPCSRVGYTSASPVALCSANCNRPLTNPCSSTFNGRRVTWPASSWRRHWDNWARCHRTRERCLRTVADVFKLDLLAFISSGYVYSYLWGSVFHVCRQKT